MTLIEVMIVMVIMTMIATAAAFGATHVMEGARVRTTATDARTIAAAATGYLIEQGTCPTLDELGSSGILSAGSSTADGWDQPFDIECDGGDPLVRSVGPDGQRGTDDDIDSRKKVH